MSETKNTTVETTELANASLVIETSTNPETVEVTNVASDELAAEVSPPVVAVGRGLYAVGPDGNWGLFNPLTGDRIVYAKGSTDAARTQLFFNVAKSKKAAAIGITSERQMDEVDYSVVQARRDAHEIAASRGASLQDQVDDAVSSADVSAVVSVVAKLIRKGALNGVVSKASGLVTFHLPTSSGEE